MKHLNPLLLAIIVAILSSCASVNHILEDRTILTKDARTIYVASGTIKNDTLIYTRCKDSTQILQKRYTDLESDNIKYTIPVNEIVSGLIYRIGDSACPYISKDTLPLDTQINIIGSTLVGRDLFRGTMPKGEYILTCASGEQYAIPILDIGNFFKYNCPEAYAIQRKAEQHFKAAWGMWGIGAGMLASGIICHALAVAKNGGYVGHQLSVSSLCLYGGTIVFCFASVPLSGKGARLREEAVDAYNVKYSRPGYQPSIGASIGVNQIGLTVHL